MKRTLVIGVFLISCFLPVSVYGKTNGDRTNMENRSKEKVKPSCEIRVHYDKKKIYEGDSLLVTVEITGSYPFQEIKVAGPFQMKNCHVRSIQINRDATRRRRYENNKVLYSIVWGQYVITPSKKGRYTLPSLRFDVTFSVARQSESSFEDFFFGKQPEYKTIKVKAYSEKSVFDVVEKPLPTTKDLLKSGGVII